jgi:hypothetical protein
MALWLLAKWDKLGVRGATPEASYQGIALAMP